MKICFLTKKDKFGVREAIDLTQAITKDIDIFYGNFSNPFPRKIAHENYDMIISYISPWIVPKAILNKTKQWNINFHPGPPEYPGIGCFNFAIYDSVREFGVTAHNMESKVDTGEIIGVRRFSMAKEETVKSLSKKTYSALLLLYKDIIDYFAENNSLPQSSEIWKREPYKRSELEDLATIKPSMSEEEIKKRIRSTYYQGKPAPFIKLFNHKFEYNPDR